MCRIVVAFSPRLVFGDTSVITHRPLHALCAGAIMVFASTSAAHAEPAKPIKVGIIGLDTSHVLAFTKAMNDKSATGDLAAVEVVAAFPGGSPDIAVQPRPRRRLYQRAARYGSRDRRLDRRTAAEGRRRALGKRRRPAAFGTGHARDQGPQAAVYRQAGGRHAWRMPWRFTSWRKKQRPLLLQLIVTLQPAAFSACERTNA